MLKEKELVDILENMIKSLDGPNKTSSRSGRGCIVRKTIERITCLFKLVSSPHYSFVIQCGETIIECIILDLYTKRNTIIKAHQQEVEIFLGVLVVERIILKKEQIYVNLVFHADQLYINNTRLPALDIFVDKTLNDSRVQRFQVESVTTPNFSNSSKPFVFVLAKFPDGALDNGESLLWLMLVGNQVAWKEFLTPKAECLMTFPLHIPINFYKRNNRSIWSMVSGVNLQDVKEHPDFFPVIKGALLPQGVHLYLKSNPRKLNPPFDPSSLGILTISSANKSKENIMSFFGKIKSIDYDNPPSWNKCMLCKQTSYFTNIEKKSSDSWIMSSDVEWIKLPEVEPSKKYEYSYNKENVTTIIRIEDIETYENITLYIRNWRQFIKPLALCEGQLLRVNLVNSCFSNNGVHYVTSCSLSSFQILFDAHGYKTLQLPVPKYGFTSFPMEEKKKYWCIIEIFKLVSATIHSLCKECLGPFSKGICHCNKCCGRQYVISVEALISVESLNGSILILLKGDQVRTIFNLTKFHWDRFSKAFGDSVSSVRYHIKDEPLPFTLNKVLDEETTLKQYFYFFCKLLPNKQFHINVTCLSNVPGKLFCICNSIGPSLDEIYTLLALS
uniref:CST complex subunit CTC1 n=1 Tax=Clastoptera arizonana TaxID=38151 RepID=A0A1B6EFG5_9HEMI